LRLRVMTNMNAPRARTITADSAGQRPGRPIRKQSYHPYDGLATKCITGLCGRLLPASGAIPDANRTFGLPQQLRMVLDSCAGGSWVSSRLFVAFEPREKRIRLGAKPGCSGPGRGADGS
jgi:hypothetical protein